MKSIKPVYQMITVMIATLAISVLWPGQGALANDPITKETTMQIIVTGSNATITYQLKDSTASRELYAQLPMTISVEDYGGLEKIFYPPNKLATDSTPLVKKANPGTLAYYAPWGDVVMFYKSFGSASGLYELGHATSGSDQITALSGTIKIDKAAN